jgi:hypothetical protein
VSAVDGMPGVEDSLRKGKKGRAVAYLHGPARQRRADDQLAARDEPGRVAVVGRAVGEDEERGSGEV